MAPQTEKPATAGTVKPASIDRLGGAIVALNTPVEASPQEIDAALLCASTAAQFRDWQRRSVSEAIKIGVELRKIKRALGHGKFIDWLQAEFGEAEVRTLQRLMAVAQRFEGKNDTVSFLPLSVIYKLASRSTPQAIVEATIKDLQSGEKINVGRLNSEIRRAAIQRRSTRNRGRPAQSATGTKSVDPFQSLVAAWGHASAAQRRQCVVSRKHEISRLQKLDRRLADRRTRRSVDQKKITRTANGRKLGTFAKQQEAVAAIGEVDNANAGAK